MRFRLLGGLGAEDDHGRTVELGGPKQRTVLASLLVAPGRPVSAAQLQDQVWGTSPPANPETSLQAYVSNLRRALEPERKPRQPARLIVTRAAGYALLTDRASVDATAFEDEVQRGCRTLADGDPGGAVEVLERALARWSGPPLPELAGEPWVDQHASWMDGLRRRALAARFDAGLLLGEHASLVPHLEQALADHPFEEHLWGQLALALYRSGRQRDALEALSRARAVLRDEVGIDPGPELQHLEASVLAQDPALDLPTVRARPRDRRSPPTLRAPVGPEDDGPPGDREDDGDRAGPGFVGRDKELGALLVAARAGHPPRGTACRRERRAGDRARHGSSRSSRASCPASTVVAWGRCPESAAGAAYWPCIQIGRQLEGAGVLPADLAGKLLPEDDVQTQGDDAGADRLSLHVSVAKVLGAASNPLVLVVDDLQWADGASLRVIEFVASELRRTNVLLVVTVRPVPPGARPALIDCLGELARQPGAVRIDLGGLSNDDVQRWLAQRTSAPADPEVARAVNHRTGGNPFFVSEVVELLAAEGRPVDIEAVRRGSGVPAAVQDVVRRRISRLPVTTQQLLTAASVVGRTFDLDVLAAVVEDTVADILDRLDPALAVGLVDDTDVPGPVPVLPCVGRRDPHAELSPTRRARLHAATALALARLRVSDLAGHLAELAHHAVEGAIAGTATEAYDWSVQAARQATLRLAHEEAAEHWARATRALELARPGDAEARYEALAEEGRAWLRVDAVDPGYTALVRALELAMTMGDGDRVAEAAASMSIDGVWQTGEVALSSVDAVGSLERALATLPETPTTEGVLATGAMAEAAYWLRPPEWLDEMTARAVADARALGDPATLGRALHKRNQALWRAAYLDERAAAAEELFAMAQEQDLPPALEATARFGMAGVCWERAEVVFASEQAQIAQQIAHRLGSPALMTQVDWFACAMATFAGRLDEAERLCDRAYELYRRTRRWSAETLDAGLRMLIMLEQGRVEELQASAHLLLDSPYRPWFQEGYAYGLVELGLLDEAASVLEGSPLPPLIDCWMYLGLLAAAMHVRVALGRPWRRRHPDRRATSVPGAPGHGGHRFGLRRRPHGAGRRCPTPRRRGRGSPPRPSVRAGPDGGRGGTGSRPGAPPAGGRDPRRGDGRPGPRRPAGGGARPPPSPPAVR